MPVHPPFKRSYELLVVFIIMVVAFVFRFQNLTTTPPGLYPDEAMNGNNARQALETGNYKLYYPENNGREGLFINIQAQSLRLFGNQPWALRIVSALFGLLTVLGTYLLAKQLFNWQTGAIASFLLATSFWHTLFSRIGFRAILAPFLLVWGLYFFWRGKNSLKLWNFAIGGAFLGLGFHTYIAYRMMPLVIVFALIAYWDAIHKEFHHDKYIHVRNELARGFALLMIVALIFAAPILIYFYGHQDDFLGRTSQISIFSDPHPLQSFLQNTGATLGMFNIYGDYNARHNIPGRPEVFWAAGIFFVLGLVRCCIKIYRGYKHKGFAPPAHVLLLAWFLLGLLPVILSNEGIPHALRAILVAPVVFIFAGEGLWWLYDFCSKWYGMQDDHQVIVHGHHGRESRVLAAFAVCAVLFGIMLNEYHAYFKIWAQDQQTADAFSTRYVQMGEMLNMLPYSVKKYVVVNARGLPVNGIPMPAQTIMFITDTYTGAKQKEKNIYYLSPEMYRAGQYDRVGSQVFFLEQP